MEAAPEAVLAVVVAHEEAVGATGAAVVVLDVEAGAVGPAPLGEQLGIGVGTEDLLGRGVELADDADERDLFVEDDLGLVGSEMCIRDR